MIKLKITHPTGATTTKEGATFQEVFNNLGATSGENIATFGDLLKLQKKLNIKMFVKGGF